MRKTTATITSIIDLKKAVLACGAVPVIVLMDLKNVMSHKVEVTGDADDSDATTEVIREIQGYILPVIALTSCPLNEASAITEDLRARGVEFSKDYLNDCNFRIGDKQVGIKDGIIFCGGENQQDVIEYVFTRRLNDFQNWTKQVVHIDSDKANCEAVRNTLTRLDKVPTSLVYSPKEKVNTQAEKLHLLSSHGFLGECRHHRGDENSRWYNTHQDERSYPFGVGFE